jgi:hypothetical protein
MKRNVTENNLGGKLLVQEWNWLAPPDALPSWAAHVDLIIGSGTEFTCFTATFTGIKVQILTQKALLDIVYNNTSAYLHLSRHLAQILSRPLPLSPEPHHKGGVSRSEGGGGGDREQAQNNNDGPHRGCGDVCGGGGGGGEVPECNGVCRRPAALIMLQVRP